MLIVIFGGIVELWILCVGCVVVPVDCTICLLRMMSVLLWLFGFGITNLLLLLFGCGGRWIVLCF